VSSTGKGDSVRVLVVDDEPLARQRLVQLMADIPGFEICCEAANGLEALKAADSERPDIILLDIRMPGMDGMEVARHLSQVEESPAIIFTTAYGEHFDAHAIDYLLKPVKQERLKLALEKAQKMTAAQSRVFEQESGERRSHICARVRGNLKLIPLEEVLYFQADQKYVTVRYEEGEVLIEESLKALEDEFADQFMRIHRNALVARDKVVGMEKMPEGGQLIVIRGIGAQLEVSRRHVAEVRKFLKSL
jgi:two-component system, LytTR family, response regulator AlgR